jgi:hypothetical protein
MFFVFKNVCTVSRFTFHIKSAAVSFLFVCWTEPAALFLNKVNLLNNISNLQNSVWKKSKIASQFISQLFVLVWRVVTPATPQAIQLQCLFLYCILFRWTYSNCRKHFKGTQDWDFFWLRFWNLYYFFISYVKIVRFYKKNFLIRPLLGEIRFFRLV